MGTMLKTESEMDWIQMLDRANEMERRARSQLKFILEMKELLYKSRTGNSHGDYRSRCSRA